VSFAKCCILCGTERTVGVGTQDLSRVDALRESFARARAGHRLKQLEAKDLTKFTRDGPAEVLGCLNCGVLPGDEYSEGRYESDDYGSSLMDPRYPH
jgi:hypothetical protein